MIEKILNSESVRDVLLRERLEPHWLLLVDANTNTIKNIYNYLKKVRLMLVVDNVVKYSDEYIGVLMPIEFSKGDVIDFAKQLSQVLPDPKWDYQNTKIIIDYVDEYGNEKGNPVYIK